MGRVGFFTRQCLNSTAVVNKTTPYWVTWRRSGKTALLGLLGKNKKMAVPKSKITKSKRNMRRAHDALSSDAYVEDKVTGELHRPHHIDLKTGMYRGKQVLKVKERI